MVGWYIPQNCGFYYTLLYTINQLVNQLVYHWLLMVHCDWPSSPVPSPGFPGIGSRPLHGMAPELGTGPGRSRSAAEACRPVPAVRWGRFGIRSHGITKNDRMPWTIHGQVGSKASLNHPLFKGSFVKKVGGTWFVASIITIITTHYSELVVTNHFHD